jgi:hypothetical protein
MIHISTVRVLYSHMKHFALYKYYRKEKKNEKTQYESSVECFKMI